jgi:hypothetical protein
VHNGNGANSVVVARALFAATDVLSSGDGKLAVSAAGKMLAAALNGVTDLETLLGSVPVGKKDAIRAAAEDENAFAATSALHAELCRRALRLAPGEAAVVVNGRVVGPLAADETLTAEDYKILEKTVRCSAFIRACMHVWLS